MAVWTAGCSLSKSLPENEYLYTGSKVVMEKKEKGINTKKLGLESEELIKKPLPNKRFLKVRWGLRLYNLFYTEKKKGLWFWLREKLGKPPVVFDEKIVGQTEQLLENRAVNNGFFHTKVRSEIIRKKQKAKVKYTVEVEPPFRLDTIVNGIADSLIRRLIVASEDSSLLKPGKPYQLDFIKLERTRIEMVLKKNGFYFFQDDYLKYLADTTYGEPKIRLELVIKEDASPENLKPQTIHRIFVFPDYSESAKTVDTLNQNGLTILHTELLLRPSELDYAILFETGKLYNLEAHQTTLQRLSALQMYQFINVQFERAPEADTLLNVFVYLTPRKKSTAEGAAGFSVKPSAYFGPELSLTFTNRNLFRSAEQLKVKMTGNFNFPLAANIVSYNEQEIEGQLSKPRMMTPFPKISQSDRLIGRTRLNLKYSRQKVRLPMIDSKALLEMEGFNELLALLNADSTFAPFIALNNFNIGYGYQWRKRQDIQHELNPFQVIFQNPVYEVPELKRLILTVGLLSASQEVVLNLERMVIFKPDYIFLFDSRLKKLKTNNFFYRGRSAFSANRVLSSTSVIPKNLLEGQFLQLENDFRYFRQLSIKQVLAFRLAGALAIPFNTDAVLPFTDLYTVGGPNSIRAFPPRQLGPGSVPPSNETFFFTGTGDVRLESSVEFRQKLTNLFELGFFADAGNVWLLRSGSGGSDLSKFYTDKFYRQIALGTGFGLRLDFEVLLLRLDLAFPLTLPWRPEGERWVGDEIDPLSRSWRKDNLTLNFAFGYSF